MNALEPVLQPIARLLNRNIQSTTPARKLCSELVGTVVAVRVSKSDVTAWFVVRDDRLDGTTETQEDPDVERTGDASLAEKFQQLLEFANPDLEEELSGVVGDAAAHRIGEFARGVSKWGAEARATMGDNIREYLQEESRDLPTRYEMDRFTANVDVLRDDVERLAARIQRLQKN